MRYVLGVVLLGVLGVTAGCGESTELSAPKSPIRQIDTSTLPPLGEYAPPLDGGRIEIAGPAQWQLEPRTQGYVVRFVASQADQYPMILVKAEDSSTEPLTSESAVAFATALAADGSAKPAAIGQRVGVLQLKRGKEPNTIDRILEQLIFTTVLGTRTYHVELRSRPDRLKEYQDSLFAVVAGMRPSGADGSGSNSEGSGTKEDSQAGEKANEEQPKAAGQKELDKIFE